MNYSKDVTCGVRGCSNPAEFKIAAPWSYGRFAELKTYGLVCTEHRAQLYEAAVERGRKHSPSSEEEIGEIAVYHYERGKHDRELEKVGRMS